VAVFEVLIMTDELREELKKAPNTQQLMALAASQGLVPMRSAALKRALAGDVSLAEALRVSE
jgi:type II secretory ATPase GspE/PulE/Tfp pilus assembly ATPase PilB-like protein